MKISYDFTPMSSSLSHSKISEIKALSSVIRQGITEIQLFRNAKEHSRQDTGKMATSLLSISYLD